MNTGVLKLIAAPSGEPVTRQEAKDFAQITISADDTLVDGLITAARRKVEVITARALITQTWEVYFDSFPDGDYWSLSRPLGVRPFHREWLPTPSREAIRIPLPPLLSVGFVKYTDPAGVLQTLASNAYNVDVITEPARITPVYGTLWPLTRADANAMFVRFDAGYGNAAAVPEDIKTAIKMIIRTIYDNRANFVVGQTAVPIPSDADSLLQTYRVSMV